jgi:hypothetical protein
MSEFIRVNRKESIFEISILVLCFNAMYQWTLYEYGYSMNDDNLKNFRIVKKVDKDEIGWTLGYMINQTNSLEAQYRPQRLLSRSEFIGLLVLFVTCLVIFTIIGISAVYFYKSRQHY